MAPGLILALVQQILIPEISVAIRAHLNATGKMPTDTEILAALQLDAAKVIDRGQSWLAAHPEPATK